MATLHDHTNRDLTVYGHITVADSVLQVPATVKSAKGRDNRGIIWMGNRTPTPATSAAVKNCSISSMSTTASSSSQKAD